MLRAGAAEVDITPEVGSRIPGQWLETWLARSSKLAPEAGGLMVEAARKTLADVAPGM